MPIAHIWIFGFNFRAVPAGLLPIGRDSRAGSPGRWMRRCRLGGCRDDARRPALMWPLGSSGHGPGPLVRGCLDHRVHRADAAGVGYLRLAGVRRLAERLEQASEQPVSDELAKPGISVPRGTVRDTLKRAGIDPALRRSGPSCSSS